jgi:hypothetical protein
MIRRGTFSRRRALRQITRNVVANAVKAMFAEPNIDRAGRLRGNLHALFDLFRHRCHPKRILDL